MGPTLQTKELLSWARGRLLGNEDTAQLKAVFEERDALRATLLSKHGGEPLALLEELDAARATSKKLAEALKSFLRWHASVSRRAGVRMGDSDTGCADLATAALADYSKERT